MPVTLNNSNLLEYFPGVVKKISAFFYHKDAVKLLPNFDAFNPYYFRSRSSDTLLVTVGDSWTWAMECTGRSDFDHFYAPDWAIERRIISNINQNRIDHAYGNIISDTFNSDWLNLGVPGWGNLQIADLFKNLNVIIPELTYKKIIVICTLTEIGRWFNTEEDQHIDHARLLSLVEESQSVDTILEELNRMAIDQILTSLRGFPHVQLLVGTNFVDHLGLDQLAPEQILSTPWYQLLNISYETPIYNSTILTIDGFERGLSDGLIPKKLHTLFKSWVVSAMDKSEIFYKSLARSPYFTTSHHPLYDGQKIWADYIIKHI